MDYFKVLAVPTIKLVRKQFGGTNPLAYFVSGSVTNKRFKTLTQDHPHQQHIPGGVRRRRLPRLQQFAAGQKRGPLGVPQGQKVIKLFTVVIYECS